MFDTTLIESGNLQRRSGGALTTLVSLVVHTLVIGAFVAAGYFAQQTEAIERPIEAFLVGSPPPPPPPPPPPAATSSTPKPVTPKVETPQVEQDSFVTPTEIKELPDVEIEQTSEPVEGGVVGGVEGGVAGGVIGGVVGGVIGGTIGGTLGGTLGGTGTGPLRVGGNVKPPQVVYRVEPGYTEPARRERIQGVVILEAIIDMKGNVTDVRVLKPLPEGLDQSAIDAVKQWKFKPGTREGVPVPVVFTLTVTFRLH